MKNSIQLIENFSVKPAEIYKAWLSSDGHSKMTGGEAICTDKVGDTYSAWDEYISGINQSLTPNQEIVQTWRSTEFEDTDEDSLVTVKLKAIESGCELTLIHTNIPEGQAERYEQGWIDHYFKPMHNYF